MKVKKKFDNLFKDIEFDAILIENQISPIANRMKCLQGMMTQYFIMKNWFSIEYVSSSNKLKGFTTKNMNYKQRKQYSIDTAKQIIQNNPILHGWIPFFSEHKKKDDLADSYLQGLWFINNKLT